MELICFFIQQIYNTIYSYECKSHKFSFLIMRVEKDYINESDELCFHYFGMMYIKFRSIV